MPILLRLSFIGLILSIGATVATYQIPELSIEGIWGLPVLGFALIIGVMFRIGVLFDPRKSYNGEDNVLKLYVLLSIVIHLISMSMLDYKNIHLLPISMKVITVIIDFALIFFCYYVDFAWVLSQTQNLRAPSLFAIRRAFIFNASIFTIVALLIEGLTFLKMIYQPILIFNCYFNWVYFAAICSGIFREPESPTEKMRLSPTKPETAVLDISCEVV